MLTDAYAATREELREEIQALTEQDRKANAPRLRFLWSVLTDKNLGLDSRDYSEIEGTYPKALHDQTDNLPW